MSEALTHHPSWPIHGGYRKKIFWAHVKINALAYLASLAPALLFFVFGWMMAYDAPSKFLALSLGAGIVWVITLWFCLTFLRYWIGGYLHFKSDNCIDSIITAILIEQDYLNMTERDITVATHPYVKSDPVEMFDRERGRLTLTQNQKDSLLYAISPYGGKYAQTHKIIEHATRFHTMSAHERMMLVSRITKESP